MTDILEQLSDAKGALRSFATLKGAFSAAEAAVQAIEAARAEIAALREARAALPGPSGAEDDAAEADWQAWDEELASPEGQAKLVRLAAAQRDAPDAQR